MATIPEIITKNKGTPSPLRFYHLLKEEELTNFSVILTH